MIQTHQQTQNDDQSNSLADKYINNSKIIDISFTCCLGAIGLWAELDDNKEHTFLFILSFFVLVLLSIFSKSYVEKKKKTAIQQHQDQILELEERMHNQNVLHTSLINRERTNHLENCLGEISEGLNFLMTERICIYSYLPKDNEFECLVRFSKHGTFDQFSERKRYPANSGIIGKVWSEGQHNGKFRDKNFPCPKTNFKKYKQYIYETYHIPIATINKFRMKSIDIYAELIRDTKGKQVAVIIFESQENTIINESSIEKVYTEQMTKRIVSLVSKLRTHTGIFETGEIK